MDRRDAPFDDRDVDRRGPDFLSEVREVCRLRVDQDRSTAGAEIIEREERDGEGFDHLIVRYTRGPWTKELLVGALDGPLGSTGVARFQDAVCAHTSTDREPELVYRGPTADPDAVSAAAVHRIWLRSFAEYQQLWDHAGYVAAQTRRLRADPEYPLPQHVDKRWSELGERDARPTTAASRS